MRGRPSVFDYPSFFGPDPSRGAGPAGVARQAADDTRFAPIPAPIPVTGADWTLRRARPDDEPAIRALVRAEALNPTDLRYPAFVVACTGERVVGAAQVRLHRDGSREFGSLVVAPSHRGRGIGTALIGTLLAQENRRLHVITGRANISIYERHGFRCVPGRSVPWQVRRNLRIGQFVGHLRRLGGRVPLGLCVLERAEIGGLRNLPVT